MLPDLTTLRLFLAVAEEGSIGKAAEREHISGPAISKRIIELEQSLGVTLLERQNVGVTLTPAGSALLGETRVVLQSIERMKSTLSEFATGHQGRVRIIFSPAGQAGYLPTAIRAYMRAHPLVEIHLDERHSVQVIEAIAQGEGDIGIFAMRGDTKALCEANGLQIVPYQTLRLALVARPDHPLASRRRVAFAEVVKFDLIRVSESSLISELLRHAADAEGLTLNCRLQVSTLDSARRMIQAELGVAIMSELSASAYSKAMDLACVPLSDAWAEYQLAICARSPDRLSRSVRLMLECLTGPGDAISEPHQLLGDVRV